MNELWSNINLELSNFDRFIYYELQEELVNTLQMRPCWIDFILLLNTCLRKIYLLLINIRERPEDVLFDHCHDIVEVRDDKLDDCLLILKVLLHIIDGVESLLFGLLVLLFILVVVALLTNQQFLLELILSLLLVLNACSSS